MPNSPTILPVNPSPRPLYESEQDWRVVTDRPGIQLNGRCWRIQPAAKYGGGSVFVTVEDAGDFVEMLIEDDGRGIPEAERERIFDRGVRLDTGKPGTGLGLAIVRDVAEIYDGSVSLEESEDLGGLLARLRLPLAE